MIGVHPRAFTRIRRSNRCTKMPKLMKMMAGYASPVEYYIGKLTEGIATLSCKHSGQNVSLFACLIFKSK